MKKGTQMTERQEQNAKMLGLVHRFAMKYSPTAWMKETPEATLGQLKERVEEALAQCIAFGDELILDHEDEIPQPLSDELAEWELPEDEEDQTFDYRVANLEEIVEDLEDLIEWLGDDFEVVAIWPYGERWYRLEACAIPGQHFRTQSHAHTH